MSIFGVDVSDKAESRCRRELPEIDQVYDNGATAKAVPWKLVRTFRDGM